MVIIVSPGAPPIHRKQVTNNRRFLPHGAQIMPNRVVVAHIGLHPVLRVLLLVSISERFQLTRRGTYVSILTASMRRVPVEPSVRKQVFGIGMEPQLTH